MRIVTISDTHNRHKRLTSNAEFPNVLPEGDLLIHAGDFSGVGTKSEVDNFLEWLVKIRYKFTYGIVFIAGNHDRSFDTKYMYEHEDYDLFDMHQEPSKPFWLKARLSEEQLENKKIYYLENTSVEIAGIKIWGSPYTPWFHGDRWAFNRRRGNDIKVIWDTIPNDTNIIVTHGPAMYKLDYVPHDKHYAGCEDLNYAIRKIKPVLHVAGHIHEGYGYEQDEHTTYINPSICNHRYEPVNKPIVFDYDSKTIVE